jgi:UDP-N-acetylmuramyl pentapeptide phosphotransferase/UDP-N-acetylglucosamine-1-phosphate transferase
LLFLSGSALFAIVLCLSYLGVALVRRRGLKRNRVAVPNERSLHVKPVPYGGGLIIAIICIAAYLPISYFVLNTFSWGYFSGALLITLVSYLDDVRRVGFLIRLAVHAIAAVLLITDLDTWHGITMLRGFQMGPWAYPLTFIWVVWMVNAYNFMDGVDGLAGLQATIAGVGWLALGYMLDMPALYFFGGIIAASSLGFLIHNWPAARIFLGDVGSAFLGYTFAALPLMARHMANRDWDLLPIAAVLFVWFFLFDSIATRLRRLVRGDNVLEAHREHLFQRLVVSGWSHKQVTLFYGSLTILLSSSVLLSVKYREDIGLAMLPLVVITTGVLLAVCASRGVLLKRIVE